MAAQGRRDRWRSIWEMATSDGVLVVLVLGIGVALTVTAWLPQTPSADPGAYARWLSKAHARFGEATAAMRSLGLFTITRSFGFRMLLALLAGCVLLRLIEDADRLRLDKRMSEPAGEWRAVAGLSLSNVRDNLRGQRYRVLGEYPLLQGDRWPWAGLFRALTHAGVLLVLSGLLLTHLWGWRAEGLVLQSGEQITLPGTERWVALNDDARTIAHSPGVVTFVEERGPGVRIGAADGAGRTLQLQQTAAADRVSQLTVALTEDHYFAIPEAQLIVRLAPQSGSDLEAHTPIRVQIYHRPPGRLAVEEMVEGSAKLTVDDVRLQLTGAPYARLSATLNPGLWPTGVGLGLLVLGLLGSVVWPARRFWLREEAGKIEGMGDLASVVETGEEN